MSFRNYKLIADIGLEAAVVTKNDYFRNFWGLEFL